MWKALLSDNSYALVLRRHSNASDTTLSEHYILFFRRVVSGKA